MADFPRTVTPVSVTELELPGPLISKSQSGRIVTRGTQAIGRTWKETYLLNVQDTTHKGFLAAVRNLWRNGTSFDISHVDYLVPKGSIGGSPLVNIASQIFANPENIGAWSIGGTPVRTSGQADPFGGTAAYLVEDNDAGAGEYISNSLAFTGNAVKALALYLKAGTATVTELQVFDSTAGTDRFRVSVNWSGGIPTFGAPSVGAVYAIQDAGSGWYRLLGQTSSVIAANTQSFIVYPAGVPNANVGTVYVFGVNVWNATVPMPYRSTTGTPILTGSYLSLDGATGSVSNWLRAGDLLKVAVGSAVGVFEATSDVTSQADGGVYVPINPPIFTGGSPADNAAVTVTGVKMRACILEPPSLPETSGLGANYGELTLSFSETLGA